VKTTETVKISPRMIVGKLALPKRQINSELVCIEPAQMPHECILAARGISPVLPAELRLGRSRETSRCLRSSHLIDNIRREYFHVMVVNFSQEEVVIPRATLVGVAEEISPYLVAAY